MLHSFGLRFRITTLALVDTSNADIYWSKVTFALTSKPFMLSLRFCTSTLYTEVSISLEESEHFSLGSDISVAILGDVEN